jgi:hypothetical protein
LVKKPPPTLKDVCDELGVIKHLWFEFGVQLGIPRGKLEEFEGKKDPFSAVVDYWLRGNIEGVPIAWKSVVKALESRYVWEKGLAKRIRISHCKEGKSVKIRANILILL